MFDVLDQLIGPLNAHITVLFSQPVTGTDDAVTLLDTKRAYLALLNSIMSSKLHGIFISEREYLLEGSSHIHINNDILYIRE